MKDDDKAVQQAFCVITHPCWNGESHLSFEQLRFRWVDLIDQLLEVLNLCPQYIINLDAQTMVLEEYLRVRPMKEPLLKHYVKNGNMIIGPWYLQTDFYLTSGEAIIRNLIAGCKQAYEFGANTFVGYAPDQCGSISQLPQILKEFGVDMYLFKRGFGYYSKDKEDAWIELPSPAEFIWYGADGSQMLAVQIKNYGLASPAFPLDVRTAQKVINKAAKELKPISMTPYAIILNGVDHLIGQDALLASLSSMQDSMEDGGKTCQMSMHEYLRCVKEYIQDNALSMREHWGELRCGNESQIMNGVLSTRHYLKVSNVKLQNLLENQLEPLYAMLELSGCHSVYSSDQIHYFWIELLKNQYYRFLYGCCEDDVHQHMEANFARIEQGIAEWIRRGMKEAAYISRTWLDDNDYVLMVANTLGYPVKGVAEIEIILPCSENMPGFVIENLKGEILPCKVFMKEQQLLNSCFQGNHSLVPVDIYRGYVFVDEMAPFSFRSYRIRPSLSVTNMEALCCNDSSILENEFLRVEIREYGKLDIQFMNNNRLFQDCLYWEDTADCGDAYIFRSAGEQPVTSHQFQPTVEIVEKNEYVQRCRLAWKAELPVQYDFEKQCRSIETAVTAITMDLVIYKSNPILELHYAVDNHSCDHRLRFVLSNGELASQICYADTPFDIIRRVENALQTVNREFSNTSFVTLEGAGKNMAVFTEGAHACEQLGHGRLAFTVLRATGRISGSEKVFEGNENRSQGVPNNQCQRLLQGRLGLYSYSGYFDKADIPKKAQQFRNPLQCMFTARGGQFTGRAFIGKHENVVLQENKAAFLVNGQNILFSALKQAEDENGTIARFYNCSNQMEIVTVHFDGFIYRTTMSETKSQMIGTQSAELSVAAKEIVTLRLVHKVSDL